MKIRNLGFPKAVEDNAYALLECREPFAVIKPNTVATAAASI